MPRRNVVFDKGRGWRAEDDRYRALHLGPDRGAAIGEYAATEPGEFSDSYYGPGDDYAGRDTAADGYNRGEGEPARRDNEPAGMARGRARSAGSGNRTYGEVYSYGELRPGERSWADLRASSTPSFRGRGPKGYTRSDERVLEAICACLTDDPRIDASDISVQVSDGDASLTGSVADKRTKWLVEDIVESVSGVKRVDNRLRCPRAP